MYVYIHYYYWSGTDCGVTCIVGECHYMRIRRNLHAECAHRRSRDCARYTRARAQRQRHRRRRRACRRPRRICLHNSIVMRVNSSVVSRENCVAYAHKCVSCIVWRELLRAHADTPSCIRVLWCMQMYWQICAVHANMRLEIARTVFGSVCRIIRVCCSTSRCSDFIMSPTLWRGVQRRVFRFELHIHTLRHSQTFPRGAARARAAVHTYPCDNHRTHTAQQTTATQRTAARTTPATPPFHSCGVCVQLRHSHRNMNDTHAWAVACIRALPTPTTSRGGKDDDDTQFKCIKH